MKIKDTIEKLSTYVGRMISALEQADPSEGLEKSAEILLDMTGKSEIRDARYSIKQTLGTLSSYIKFAESKKAAESLVNIDYLRKADVPKTYKALKNRQSKLMDFLIAKEEEILVSEKDYKSFDSKFSAFKEKYVEAYVEEHDLRNSMLQAFCKDFESNISFKILEEIEEINKKFVSRSPGTIRETIFDYRGNACTIKKQTIRRFLRDDTTCTCDHKLNGKEEVIKEIEGEETEVFSQLREECMRSLRTFRSALDANRAKFDELLKEQGLVKQGNKLLEALEEILEKPIEEKQLEYLLKLLRTIESVLKKTFEVVKVPKPTYVRLSDILRKLKAESGETTTVKGLIEWIRQKYGEEEEILIDIS